MAIAIMLHNNTKTKRREKKTKKNHNIPNILICRLFCSKATKEKYKPETNDSLLGMEAQMMLMGWHRQTLLGPCHITPLSSLEHCLLTVSFLNAYGWQLALVTITRKFELLEYMEPRQHRHPLSPLPHTKRIKDKEHLYSTAPGNTVKRIRKFSLWKIVYQWIGLVAGTRGG